MALWHAKITKIMKKNPGFTKQLIKYYIFVISVVIK